MSFCAQVNDRLGRQYCDWLVRQYDLKLSDFDVGEAKFDLTGKLPKNVRTKPDGKASVPEIFALAVKKAEEEVVANAKSLRETGKEIPTPLLNFLRSTDNDVPWFFKKKDSFKEAVEVTRNLGDIYQRKGAYSYFKQLYKIVRQGKEKGGHYGITYSGSPAKKLVDIDKTLKDERIQCVQFAFAMHGLNLVAGGPALEIITTKTGSNLEHVFLGFKVFIGRRERHYLIDPNFSRRPIFRANRKRLHKTVKASKSQLVSMYKIERSERCMDEKRNIDQQCVKEDMGWASRYAPDYIDVIFMTGIWIDRNKDYAGADEYMKKALKMFPNFYPASIARYMMAQDMKAIKK